MYSQVMADSFNAHVFMYEVDVPHKKAFDVLIGILFIPCLIFATIGNILSLRYFWKSKVRNISNSLYIAISVVDIVTGTIHLPVTRSLFNSRFPGIFNYVSFCSFWNISLIILLKFPGQYERHANKKQKK